MNEPFVLQVNEQDFKARFERWGYTHRFFVLIGDETYTFEPDEEGSYRALGNVAAADLNLLRAVADKLVSLADKE